MNQKEIGELMWIDYYAVRVVRSKLSVLKEEDPNLF